MHMLRCLGEYERGKETDRRKWSIARYSLKQMEGRKCNPVGRAVRGNK